MIDRLLVENKLADLQSYYIEIMAILSADSQEVIADSLKLHSLERLFQLIVDSAIDINTHIISSIGALTPDDYQSTFITLAEHQVIPHDFARRIAPSVGLRNLVVHRYGRVDIKRMVDDVRTEISQYQEYAHHVVEYLKKM